MQSYHHRVSRCYKRSRGLRTVDGSASRSTPGPASRSVATRGTASHTWRTQNARDATVYLQKAQTRALNESPGKVSFEHCSRSCPLSIPTEGVDHSFFDGTPAGATNRYASLIVTAETHELTALLPSVCGQFTRAGGAVEVVRMIYLTLESQVTLIYDHTTSIDWFLVSWLRLPQYSDPDYHGDR